MNAVSYHLAVPWFPSYNLDDELDDDPDDDDDDPDDEDDDEDDEDDDEDEEEGETWQVRCATIPLNIGCELTSRAYLLD